VNLAITAEQKNILEVDTHKRAASSSQGGSPTSKAKMNTPPQGLEGLHRQGPMWLSPQPPQQRASTPAGGNAIGPCYECDGYRHFARDCPNKKKQNAPRVPAQQQRDNQVPKNGRLNYVTTKEATADEQVIVG
jgi:hypothetical protein